MEMESCTITVSMKNADSAYIDGVGSTANCAVENTGPIDAVNASPIIDLDGIMEQQADHDNEFMLELLFDFRCEINAQLPKMNQILRLLQKDDSNHGNFGRLERAAQSIKDASLDMLCSKMHDAAAVIECHAKEKHLKGCVRGYEALENASKSLFEFLDSVKFGRTVWGDESSELSD